MTTELALLNKKESSVQILAIAYLVEVESVALTLGRVGICIQRSTVVTMKGLRAVPSWN